MYLNGATIKLHTVLLDYNRSYVYKSYYCRTTYSLIEQKQKLGIAFKYYVEA